MIWPVWMLAAAAVVVLAVFRHSAWQPAALILAGLVSTRIASGLIPAPAYLLACAALWIGLGGVIVSKYRAAVCGSLIIASGLCYPVARVIAAPVEFGSPVFVVSDFLGALALCAAAWGALSGGRRFHHVDRDSLLGGALHRRRGRAGSGAGAAQAQKGAG